MAFGALGLACDVWRVGLRCLLIVVCCLGVVVCCRMFFVCYVLAVARRTGTLCSLRVARCSCVVAFCLLLWIAFRVLSVMCSTLGDS